MTMKSKGDFKTIEDLKCQSFVPDDKLELVNQMFFAGLKDTSNEHQIEDLKRQQIFRFPNGVHHLLFPPNTV